MIDDEIVSVYVQQCIPISEFCIKTFANINCITLRSCSQFGGILLHPTQGLVVVAGRSQAQFAPACHMHMFHWLSVVCSPGQHDMIKYIYTMHSATRMLCYQVTGDQPEEHQRELAPNYSLISKMKYRDARVIVTQFAIV